MKSLLQRSLLFLVGINFISVIFFFTYFYEATSFSNSRIIVEEGTDGPHVHDSENGGATLALPSVTVLITAHPIPSHPSLKHFDQAIGSLSLLSMPPDKIPIILVCDAPKKLHETYQQFKEAVRLKYPSVKIVETAKPEGICNNMKTGMAHVNTKYVLTVQHDMPFARTLEIPAAVQVMERFPNRVKYIRFNQMKNTCKRTGCDDKDCGFYREQRFPVRLPWNNTATDACMALIRSVCWSDNNHLTTVDYYNEVVFPKCTTGKAMEGVMESYSRAETHNITGTYIYGPLEFGWQVEHEDGSETRPQNHKRRPSLRKSVEHDRSQYSQKVPLIDGVCVEGEEFRG